MAHSLQPGTRFGSRVPAALASTTARRLQHQDEMTSDVLRTTQSAHLSVRFIASYFVPCYLFSIPLAMVQASRHKCSPR